MAFCPNCGKEVSAQAISCPNCGHPLSPTFASPSPQAAQAAKPEPSRSNKVSWIIVAVVVLFLVAFFVPMFPETFSSGSFFGVASVSVTANVSLTYMLFGCGAYNNLQYTGSVFGSSTVVPAQQSGYNLKCG